MLEIIVVVLLGRRLGKKAQSRGLDRRYGWLIVPFWIVPEFVVVLILGSVTENLLVLYGGAIAGAALGAVLAFDLVGRMGTDAVPVSGDAQRHVPGYGQGSQRQDSEAAEALRRKAGYCSECGEEVWLSPTGACFRGHGPECISGQYTPNV